MNEKTKRTAAILKIITADLVAAFRGVAKEWATTDLTEKEVRGYHAAGCYEPSAAVELQTLGVTPAEAARRTGGHDDTIGYRVSNRNITAADAVYLLLPEGF